MKQLHILLYLCLTLLCACQSLSSQYSANNAFKTKAANYNIELGLRYLAQGNMLRAKQKLLTALAKDPNSAASNDALAYYYEATGSITLARHYYLQAIHLAPGKGSPLNNYATFLCRQGRFTEANNFFRQAVADVNYINSAAAYENAGLCALAASNHRAARHYFKIALLQDPNRELSRRELDKL